LILYHGMRNFHNQSTADFIAFELIDGHLYLVYFLHHFIHTNYLLEAGEYCLQDKSRRRACQIAGSLSFMQQCLWFTYFISLQTTTKRVNEGNAWHTIAMERVGRTGSVVVDTVKTVFSTPGVSANLIIGWSQFNKHLYRNVLKTQILFQMSQFSKFICL
jgi:hypothetical protein